jgi:hypothetical protein
MRSIKKAQSKESNNTSMIQIEENPVAATRKSGARGLPQSEMDSIIENIKKKYSREVITKMSQE